jgi:hypothetical protein
MSMLLFLKYFSKFKVGKFLRNSRSAIRYFAVVAARRTRLIAKSQDLFPHEPLASVIEATWCRVHCHHHGDG